MITTNTQEQESFLVFNMRDAFFGIPVEFGQEIFQVDRIVSLPRVSPVLAGIVNLRGKIISVFDPTVLLWGIEHLEKNKDRVEGIHRTILLLTISDQELGILVGEIPQLLAIQEFKGIEQSYLEEKGISNYEIAKKIGISESNNEIIILDLNTILKGVIKKGEGIKVPTDEVDDFNMDQFTGTEESTNEDNHDFDQYTLPDE